MTAKPANKPPRKKGIWMTPEEVQKDLRCGRNQIYEMIKRGEIPSVRFGRRFRIPRATYLRMAGIDSKAAD